MKALRSPRLTWVVVALGLASGICAQAQENLPAGSAIKDTSIISDQFAKGAAGRIAVNETAGANNAQNNQAVIVQGGAIGIGVISSRQSALTSGNVAVAKSVIEGSAFSGVTGLAQVNQSGGDGNLQHNAAAIVSGAVSGVEIVPDTALSGAISKGGSAGYNSISERYREASISPDAFRNATGIVQINQSAGVGNVTANVFVLRPPAGTFF